MAANHIMVGGLGDGSLADDNNGGVYESAGSANWTNAQAANGVALFNGTVNGADITDLGDTIKFAITGIGATIGSVAGTLVNVVWDENSDFVDSRYELAQVNANDITIAYAGGDDPPEEGENATEIWIGGALLTLEAAKDLVVDASATDILISQNLAIGAAVTFTAGGDKTDTTKWLRIWGVSNVDGSLLPEGEYIVIDREGAGTDVIVWDDIDNAGMMGINPTGGIGGAGLKISNGAAAFNYCIGNCNFTSNKYGVQVYSSNVRNLFVFNCNFSDNITNDVYSLVYGGAWQNCSFLSNVPYHVTSTFMETYIGCLFVDGTYGIYSASAGLTTAIGCVFYNQTTACIGNANNDSTIVAYNNVFMPAETVDWGVRIVVGSGVYADYNCYWSVAGGACDRSHTPGEHDIEANPMLANAATGDFRLKPNSPLWNKGKRTLLDGYSTMGAWGRINLMHQR